MTSLFLVVFHCKLLYPWIYISYCVVNNYGWEGRLKCSVMFMPPSPKCAGNFHGPPLYTWKIFMPPPPPIELLCHSIDMHIWGRRTQNVFVHPLKTFKLLWPPKFSKIFDSPLYSYPSPIPALIVDNWHTISHCVICKLLPKQVL